MLKRDQITSYLGYCVEYHQTSSKNLYVSFSRRSGCHRALVLTLLHRHYSGSSLGSISSLYPVLRYSPETIRRAVKEGVQDDAVAVHDGKDRRYKRISASKLLVDCFEETHVESTD